MPASTLRRDRLTVVAYVIIAWFGYLQASPGIVVPYLRDELDFSYRTAGLHLVAFAAGSVLAGLVSARLERAVGRRRLLWGATALLAAGAVALTAGRAAEATAGSIVLMGVGGGLLLATVQATLADHHGELRTVALAEANVAAAVAYLLLIGMVSVTAALHLGWRAAVLISLLVPALTWLRHRRVAADTTASSPGETGGSLPAAFWVAAGVLMCATAVEWCVASWGATFVEDAVDVSTDTAVALMAGYFGGVVAGRVIGSRLAYRHDPAQLLWYALGTTAVGFGVLWPATTLAQALVGLTLLGIGLGNLFPMGLSVAIALAPGRAGPASGRAVMMTSASILLAPLTVGVLADATSLKAALGIIPALLAVAAAGLVLAGRLRAAARLSPAESMQ